MTTYNTGNAVPSANAKDRYDNSQTFDEVVNALTETTVNRVGRTIYTFAGMESAFNVAQFNRATEYTADKLARDTEFAEDQAERVVEFNTFLSNSGYETPVDYAPGILITRVTQQVRYLGELYRPKEGVIPFTTTTFPADAAKWISNGDNALRQELADPSKGAGLLVAWERDSTPKQVGTAGDMLSLQAINPWEFAYLVVDKPNPADYTTWDWKPAILAAAAAGPVIDGNGATFRIANTVIPSRVLMSNIKFKPASSVTGGVLLTIGGDDSHVEIYIDADGMGIGCCEATGNRVTGNVYTANITGQPQATGGTQGALKVSGMDCNMFVYAENLLLGTSANTSIPRLVTTDNTVLSATRNIIRAVGKNVQCGWVTTQDEVHCESLVIDGVRDNGIYHLQGKATAAKVRIRDCDDEPFVAKGGLQIDDLTVIDCDGFCSMSNADLSINDYKIISTDPTKRFQPLTVRADNVSSKASIGRLSGNIYLVADPSVGGIFQFAAGVVTDLTIGELDLTVHYLTGATKLLANLAVVESLNIGPNSIRLVDDSASLTVADKFDFRLPVALTRLSSLGRVFNTSSSGDVRVANVSQSLLQMPQGAEVSTSFGPYILQQSAASPTPPRITGTGAPTVGTWPVGAIVDVKAAGVGSVTRYRCVTAGSPGTWRAVAWIVGRGLTRPILSLNDIGVMFMDTALAAGGKPIWWTGTIWVDATGATV